MRPRAADRRKTKAILFAACTRTKQGEVYGYDGGKKVKGAECTARQALEFNSREPGGRRRHLIIDSQGFMVGVLVTGGNTPERLGAAMVIFEHQE